MIVELGHVGLWVDDLATMRDFYAGTVGLTVTDEDQQIGMVFLSSRPDVEHHELVLARGRVAPRDVRLVNQVSWRVADLDSLIEFHRRFVDRRVPIRQTVTHGNALGIYFEDPEGNVNEVYWSTGTAVPQPYRKSISLDGPGDAVLAAAERVLGSHPSAYERS